MFNINWFRGKAPSTSGPPVGSWFNSGVVCPDGTVMWHWEEEDNSSDWPGENHPFSCQISSTTVQNPEQIHYHYHRFGMGPWLFLGLQVSLAIALLLILSSTTPPSEQDAPVDSLAIPNPDYRIGSLN